MSADQRRCVYDGCETDFEWERSNRKYCDVHRKGATKTQLETWSKDNEVHFINTSNGRLVIFNPDLFIWNACKKGDKNNGN